MRNKTKNIPKLNKIYTSNNVLSNPFKMRALVIVHCS